MKRITLLYVLISLLAISCQQRCDLPVCPQEILDNICEPTFRAADYYVEDFGAVADSVTDCREAINQAIVKCSADGGGRVILRPGVYFSKGAIILKSNVNLHLEEGAEILYSGDPKDYLPAVLTIFEGTLLYNYSPLIYAYQAENIALTGKGVLNGQASKGFAKFRPQRSAMQNTLRQMGIDVVPIHERYFGEESILPPSMVQPFGCRNILIEGITIMDSPYWVVHPVYCDNVTVRGVTISSRNLNNDGCDPEFTTNVLVEDCVFNVGDDAIAIKAGRDNDAWTWGVPTRNVIIRNCQFNSKCNGLCIGSEMAAGVENVYMENVRIGNCHSGIYFKSNLDRGGFIKNVHVRNVVCDTVRTAFIRFETNYHGARGGFHPTLFQNFLIEDVVGNYSKECGFYAVGIEGYDLKDIYLRNVKMNNAPKPYILKHVDNVVFEEVEINGEAMPLNPGETETAKLRTF